MKTLGIVLLLVAIAATAFAQPDPRDSIILESKTVNPGAHPGTATDTGSYVYLRVWITNKDSLVVWSLALVERSTSGGAYMTLARPRNLNGTLSRFSSTLPVTSAVVSRYNSTSPDTFAFFGLFDPLDDRTIEPPNLTRKRFWEIKFDTVFDNAGTIEFDSATMGSLQTGFAKLTEVGAVIIPVNFLKSVIAVVSKGDLDGDGSLSAADVVVMKNCVFLGDTPPVGPGLCDLNCDGMSSAADVIWELNVVFLGEPFPC